MNEWGVATRKASERTDPWFIVLRSGVVAGPAVELITNSRGSIPMWSLSQTVVEPRNEPLLYRADLSPHLTPLFLSFSISSLARNQHWHINCINKSGPCLAGRKINRRCDGRISEKTRETNCGGAFTLSVTSQHPQIKKSPTWLLQGCSQRRQAVSKTFPSHCLLLSLPSEHFLPDITIFQLISCLICFHTSIMCPSFYSTC